MKTQEMPRYLEDCWNSRIAWDLEMRNHGATARTGPECWSRVMRNAAARICFDALNRLPLKNSLRWIFVHFSKNFYRGQERQ
jgi:hypothetical protein